MSDHAGQAEVLGLSEQQARNLADAYFPMPTDEPEAQR